MKTFALAVVIFVVWLFPADAESTVTLKSGEILQGDILSDTNGVVHMRAFYHNRTISAFRDISHDDIQNIQTDTPAQAAERADYFALSKFALDPDQEQSPNWYDQWIATFEKFLKDYPKSDKVPVVQEHIVACQAERTHVTNGEVKFGDQWMTPEKKAPLALQKTIQSLKRKLATQQTERQPLAEAIAAAQGNLAAAQQELANPPPPTDQPIYDDVPDQGHWKYMGNQIPKYEWVVDVPAHKKFVRTVKVPPDMSGVRERVTYYRQQIAKDQTRLAALDANIRDTQLQISTLDKEHQ